MDINVYNTKLAGMNPAELGMVWMGHFAPDRSMILDDNSGYFGQSTIGLAVMDEITQQTHAMDMNPMMGMINDYQQQTGTIGQDQHSIMSPADYINHINNQHENYNLINTNGDEDDDDDDENDIDDNNQNIIDNNGVVDDDVDDDDECLVGVGDNNNDNENCDNENDNNNCHIINNDIIYQQQQLQHHQHLQQQQILLQHNLDIDLDQQQQQQLQQQLLLQNNFNIYNNLTMINQPFCTKNSTTDSSETIIKNNLNLYTSNSSINNNSNNNNNNSNNNNSNNNTNNSINIHNKKIRPIKRPGLILKTPIAYQGNIDPSVIPIHRDGMAVCEKCGAIGVKHSFYTKERRFCSMTCARGFAYINYKRQIGNDEPDVIIDMDNKMLNSNKENNDNDNADSNYDDIELDIKKTLVHNPNFRFKMSSRNNYDNNITNYNNTTAHGTDLISTTAITDNKSKLLYNDNNINDEEVILPQEDLPQIPKINILQQQHCIQDDKIRTVRRNNKLNDSNLINNSYDWTNTLIKYGRTTLCAAPVNCFKHAPGYDMWNNIDIGIKVEVENTDCDNTDDILNDTIPHSFWVATVLRICGYKALIRYEGFDTDSSHDFWVNLCSSEVHPVGWCATRGKPLIPPRTIENKYSDWKEFLVKRLSGARTLPSTFYNKINDSFKSRFRCGLILEVVDKLRISTVKVATVNKIIGKRLYVRYYDSDTMNDNGFWCHEDSPLIHPVGWAKTIGHDLDAPNHYLKRFNNINIIENINVQNLTENDTTIDLFKMNFNITEYLQNDFKSYKFVEGMKLEAIDPLNLSTICVATVMAVLKFGYLMIRIDSYDLDESNGDWFCYHEKSPCIFPVGFCKKNQLILTPPKGFEQNTFTWEQYLLDTNSIPATENFFTLNIRHKHNFLPGMKLECADVMDPRLVCVATVSKVVGRLLKISFDGWEDEFDQWLDCDSPDMYPLGWCYLVGHKLEGPRMQTNKKEQINVSKNKKSNNTTSSYKKRKKGPKTSMCNNVQKIQHMTNLRKDKLHQQQQNQQKLQSDLEQRMLNQQNHIYNDPDDDNENEQSSSSKLDYKMEPDDLINSIIDYDVDDVVNDDEIGDYNYDEDEDDGNTTTTSEHMSETSSTTMHDRSSSSTSMYLEKQQGLLHQQQQQSQQQRVLSSSSCSSGVGGGNSSCSTTAISVNGQLTQKPPTPPPERKATSYINNSTVSNSKYIPRLIDINNLSPIEINKTLGNLVPITWNIYDVAQFLRVNDCTTYCDIFSRNKIDGKKLLQLNKDDIIKLLDMKVGPSIKIYDLIQQLKCKIYKMNNLLSSTVATAVTSPFIIINNNNNNLNNKNKHFNIINSNSSSNGSNSSSSSNNSISQNINLKKFL